MPDLSEFIVAQLNAQGVRIRSSGSKDIQAYCFRGHDHKSASLLIRKSDGAFICFGCGIKGKNWNSIRAFLPGVTLLSEQDLPDESSVIAAKIQERFRRAFMEMELPWGVEPWKGPYRHLTQYTLDAIGALRWFDGTYRCYRILFPIMIHGELKGWVARRLDAIKDRRYYNSPGMSSKEVLFPYDLVAEMSPRTIVLVEGPYDALRLVNYNIPALAIMGTNNYDPDNKGLIAGLGVGRVIVAVDSDEGGERVRYDIAMDLRSMFDVDHFYPPKGMDPGNMPKSAVEYLAKIVDGSI